jgi:hypothetical protein
MVCQDIDFVDAGFADCFGADGIAMTDCLFDVCVDVIVVFGPAETAGGPGGGESECGDEGR